MREITEKREKKGIGSGTGLVLGIAVIYILLGLAKLLVTGFDSVYLIDIAGVLLLICGIVLIVKYFMSKSYQDITKYGFSAGVLSVIAGVCMLVRAKEISAYFSLFLGICILLTSIIKLQNAVDLKGMEQKSWLVFLLIAIAFLAASVYIVLDPFGKNISETEYIYYILIADGAVNIVGTCYLAMTIRKIHKQSVRKPEESDLEEKEEKDPQAEADPVENHLQTEARQENPDEPKETQEESFAQTILQNETEPSDEEILSIINEHSDKE